MTASYVAVGGRVLVREPGEQLREVHSALTANGSDVERFERAAERAKQQRIAHARSLSSLTGVVPPLDAA